MGEVVDAARTNSRITAAYRERTPGSAGLAREAAALFPSGITHDSRNVDPYGPYIARAQGPHKWDVDGNRYVDFFGGHGALLLGHNHPVVTEPVRARLRQRMQAHDFDDIATIGADQIKGAAEYDDLRGMHFGKNRMCGTVTRHWKPDHREVGIVYCEADHCLIVPTVCGNIAQVTRRQGVAKRPEEHEGGVATAGGGSAPGGAAGDPLPSLDNMPPTGAGISSDAGSFAANSGGTPSVTASSIPVLTAGQGIVSGGGFIGGGVVGGIAVPAVPEPATWASLLAGLAALGWRVRRRPRA